MAVLLALATVASTGLGGLFALRSHDRMHLVLGLAAGVMLGLVAFDLLPELFELSAGTVAGLPTVMVAFAAGFLGLHVVERSFGVHGAHEDEYGEHHHHPRVGLAAAAALCLHSLLDGVGIGLAFQVDESVGVGVAVAVIAHDFADGLNTVSVLRAHGNGHRLTLAVLAVDAVAPLVGAASTLLFSVSEGVLGLYLGAFAGFLLYLAAADILPEAHARHPSRVTVLTTLGGVALMGVVISVS